MRVTEQIDALDKSGKLTDLEALRVTVDALETIVDDELWPLAKYRELLFVM